MTATANTAAASTNKARGRIFIASITPANVISATSKNDKPYAVMPNSLIQREGKDDMTMTVMAFGKSFTEVQDLLVEGQAVEMAVQFDGGTLKIIGLPRAKSETPAAATASTKNAASKKRATSGKSAPATKEAGATEEARRYAPIFTATITPENIVTATSKNDTPYAMMQGALVQRAGKDDKTMTVMAFGKSFTAVQDVLTEGQPVELAVQFDGGTLKVIGMPHAKSETPAAMAA